jgi:hypothetical protein
MTQNKTLAFSYARNLGMSRFWGNPRRIGREIAPARVVAGGTNYAHDINYASCGTAERGARTAQARRPYPGYADSLVSSLAAASSHFGVSLAISSAFWRNSRFKSMALPPD